MAIAGGGGPVNLVLLGVVPSLASIAPEFAAEVEAALVAKGHLNAASRVAAAVPQRCMFDSDGECVYICTSMPRPIPNLVRPAGRVVDTVFLLAESGFNVDLGVGGVILGIELAGRSDVTASLRAANVS